MSTGVKIGPALVPFFVFASPLVRMHVFLRVNRQCPLACDNNINTCNKETLQCNHEYYLTSNVFMASSITKL